jgi:hypothetical protein
MAQLCQFFAASWACAVAITAMVQRGIDAVSILCTFGDYR